MEADLVAAMSDDGSCFEAEACMTCGRSWWSDPPKAHAPAGAEAIPMSTFDARRAELRASRSTRG